MSRFDIDVATNIQPAPEPPAAPIPNLAPHDGLFDAEGPIPCFGPAVLDAEGRIVLDEAESAARSSAIRRMLKVMSEEERGGPGDDLEMWAEVLRNLGAYPEGLPVPDGAE